MKKINGLEKKYKKLFQDSDFENKTLKIPKIKTPIPYSDDRIFDDDIRRATITKTKTNKYFVSILVMKEVEMKTLEKKKVIDENKIGAFNMSLKNFLISDDFVEENPRFYKNMSKPLKKLHRNLSRKKLGSKNREKARLRLAVKYEKLVNQKKDWLHKLTRKLADKYDAIILEDISVNEMRNDNIESSDKDKESKKKTEQKNKELSKTMTLDFSWYEFTTLLEYKMYDKGGYLIKVDKKFASNQICSICHHLNKKIDPKKEEWVCENCNSTLYRKSNMNLNLKNKGIEMLQNDGVIIQSVEH